MAVIRKQGILRVVPEKPTKSFPKLKEWYRIPQYETVFSSYLSLSFEAIAMSPKLGIRINNKGILPDSKAKWTLNYTCYQGSTVPDLLTWNTIGLVLDLNNNFSYLLAEPVSSATYLFYLSSIDDAGKTQSYSTATLSTGASDIYNPDVLMPDMKIQKKKDYDIVMTQKPALVNQATNLGIDSTTFQTACTDLDTYFNSLSDWNSTAHDWLSITTSTVLATGGMAVLKSKFNDVYTEQAALVQKITLSDATIRALNGLDGNGNTGKVIVRGNNDITVRGGAPNINQFFIQSNYQESANGLFYINMYLRPTRLDDNFDSMREAKIEFWRGTSSSATLIMTQSAPLADRKYVVSTDSDPANASCSSYNWRNGTASYILNTNTPMWYLKVTIYNCYGPSDTKWFIPPSALNTDWTSQTSSPFTGGSSGGSGGGSGGSGGGSGGSCPTPDTLIDTTEGQIAARDIKVGMKVLTVHEASEDPTYYTEHEIEAVEEAENEVWSLETEDGRYLTFAANHRFLTPFAWVELQSLQPGTVILGSRVGIVKEVKKLADLAPVVKITVNDAHTYLTSGLISHNMKTMTLNYS